MSYAQIFQRLPEEWRSPLLEFAEALEKKLREQLAVRRQDLDALRDVVHELAEAQKRTEERVQELAQAQARTEERVQELAQAQARTEERVGRLEQAVERLEQAVERLAQAQAHTEERVGRLEQAVERLAQAQAHTEERVGRLEQAVERLEQAVERLAQAQVRTEERVEELARAQAATRKDLHAHLSAIGARWGIQTEESFRRAIQAILSEFTDLRVEHFSAYDAEGEVFDRPDQVEIDILIRDGQTFLGEIKSSMSKGDVYIFERKVAFYERRHGIKADGKIIITPMLDPRAQPVVDELGIRVYASAYDLGET